MKTSTMTNNITKLVNEGLIVTNFPSMGGVLVVNGVEFDLREYYRGSAKKYNYRAKRERVELKITHKELAKAMKSYRLRKQYFKGVLNFNTTNLLPPYRSRALPPHL